MTELTIDASEITQALERHVEEYTPEVGAEQVGRIVEVGDGIARVTGLPGAAIRTRTTSPAEVVPATAATSCPSRSSMGIPPHPD